MGDACENRPADCASARADAARIWPPEHQWLAVGATGASDPDGDPVTTEVTGVRQDEPVDGLGDGDTAPDAELEPGGSARVRAQRQGGGDGRVYPLSFTASDGRGGSCSGIVTTCVPHDAKEQGCVDGGPEHDSLGP